MTETQKSIDIHAFGEVRRAAFLDPGLVNEGWIDRIPLAVEIESPTLAKALGGTGIVLLFDVGAAEFVARTLQDKAKELTQRRKGGKDT